MHINTEQELYWYGLEGPCVLGTLKIVSGSGTISPEQNIGHAEKLVKHISDNLKLTNKKYKYIKSLFIKNKMFNKIFISVYLYHLWNKMQRTLQSLILLYHIFYKIKSK